MEKKFLKAEWRKLVMANYVVDKKILLPLLPAGTELDFWKGDCYVSLVGFMFIDTRIKGLRIPFHVNFEEVNLRFYVQYNDNKVWKRGVVFIKEIVPKTGITIIANTLYNEHYETMPMEHSWVNTDSDLYVEYKWKKKRWNKINVKAEKSMKPIQPGSEEEFITEHYWGYARINNNRTSEYGVEHPRWEVYQTKEYLIDVDFGTVYGKNFEFLNKEIPKSVFLAEGSQIRVLGRRIIKIPEN